MPRLNLTVERRDSLPSLSLPIMSFSKTIFICYSLIQRDIQSTCSETGRYASAHNQHSRSLQEQIARSCCVRTYTEVANRRTRRPAERKRNRSVVIGHARSYRPTGSRTRNGYPRVVGVRG